MNTPHVSEQYRCTNCEANFSFFEVDQNWKCPTCAKPISIKIEINGDFHSAYRIHPQELEVGTILTMDKVHIHEVLNVQDQKNGTYRVALKEYGVRTYKHDDWIFEIDGIWADYGY